MAIKSITFAVFTIVINLVNCEYDCLQRERTWSTDGQIELLAQVSIEQCYDALLKNQDGVALTFFKPDENNRYENICVIFGSLDGGRSCTDCISLKKDFDAHCNCFQYNYECKMESDNFLDGFVAYSEAECLVRCLATDQCYGYTWYTPENEDLANECFLLSSCQFLVWCGGCCGGIANGDSIPTTTTAKTTTAETTTAETTTTETTTTAGSYIFIFHFYLFFMSSLNLFKNVLKRMATKKRVNLC